MSAVSNLFAQKDSNGDPQSRTAVVLGVLPFLLPTLVLLGPLLDALLRRSTQRLRLA